MGFSLPAPVVSHPPSCPLPELLSATHAPHFENNSDKFKGCMPPMRVSAPPGPRVHGTPQLHTSPGPAEDAAVPGHLKVMSHQKCTGAVSSGGVRGTCSSQPLQ